MWDAALGVALSGAGTGTGGLIAIHGGKVIVKRASLRVIQKLVAALGGKITQRVLKSMLAKWVPIVGAAALGVWAKYSTGQLGKKAVEIFSKSIVLDDQVIDEEPETPAAITVTPGGIQVERIRLLIALSWIDRKQDHREQEFVHKVIEGAELSADQRAQLTSALDSGKVDAPVYAAFDGREDEKLSTVMDMIALSGIDEEHHPAERIFVARVAKELGYTKEEVDELFSAAS